MCVRIRARMCMTSDDAILSHLELASRKTSLEQVVHPPKDPFTHDRSLLLETFSGCACK